MLEFLNSLCVRAMVGAWECSDAGVLQCTETPKPSHWLQITTNTDIGREKQKIKNFVFVKF